MRPLHYLLATLLLASACGPKPVEPIGRNYTGGAVSAPQGGTFFNLIAPPVAAGTQVVPLKARLTGPGGEFTITTLHWSMAAGREPTFRRARTR